MSRSRVVRGKTLAATGSTRRYTRTAGYESEYFVEGTREAIEALAIKMGTSVEHFVDHSNPPVSRLTYRIAGASETSDPNAILEVQFNLLGNTSQRSGYECRAAQVLNAADSAVINTIKNAIRNNTTPTGLTGNALTLYQHMKLAQDTFIDVQCAFQINQVVGKDAVIPIAFAGYKRIYTSAAMIAETNPTGLYPQAIAAAYTAVLNSVWDGDTNNVPAGFRLGWLKQFPTVTSIAGGKQAISVEFWLYGWSLLYYPDAP